MIVHGRDPYNAETPRSVLARAALTPVEAFYVRNHGPVPDPATVRPLVVTGLVERDLELTVDQLRAGFTAREVTVTLQCAGNRRRDLLPVRDIPGEAPWGPGATGTARFGGVALADVLAAAGPLPAARHVAFIGADPSPEAVPPQSFGGSITLEKARRPEVLLAFDAAGAPLTPEHGAPLRSVVPGYIGARSVKWLERVELLAEPFRGFFQETAYRLLPPDGSPGPGRGVPLGEVALNADVLHPEDGADVAAGPLTARGYAFAGGERHVVRVDVSADGGETWQLAELLEDQGRWAWRPWQASFDLAPGEHEIVVRAWDSAGATQPESPASVWNPKGYANNTWGRVRVVAC